MISKQDETAGGRPFNNLLRRLNDADFALIEPHLVPANAAPNDLDNTFGPELKFIKAPGLGNQNLPPSAGMQFFGHVRIDGASGQMTVTLRDRADVALWSTTLDPKPV